MQQTRIMGYLCAFIAAVLYGSVSTVAKPAVANISPLLLSALVYLLAFALLTPIARVNRIRDAAAKPFKIAKHSWLLVASIAVAGAIIAPSLYFVGLINAKASDTALLANAEVVFTVLIAIAFFNERFTPSGYFAIILVIAGAVIVTTNLDFASFSGTGTKSQGIILILASMVFWAIDNNLSRVATRRIEVARLIQLKSLIGGSVLAAFVFLSGVSLTGITASNLTSVLFLGLGGVGASLFFFLHSIKRIGTTRTMMIYSTSAIFGLIFSALFLGEDIGIYQVTAATVMLLGIYLLERSSTPKGSLPS